MMPQKFVLHISGGSCTGKSTLGKVLGDRLPGVYTVAYDKIKWQLSGYTRDLRNLIYPLVPGFFEVVCRNNLPIILISIIRNAREFAEFTDIAQKYSYNFFSIQLTAPTEVLLQRFRERVKNAKETKSNISVTDEGLFLENNKRIFYVPEGTPSFDTSKMTSEEIVEEVLRMIK